MANQRYDDYEDELNKLKATIASLEDELDWLRHSGHQNKRARTRDPSFHRKVRQEPREPSYITAEPRPAPSTAPCAHEDIVMREEYFPPLPNNPPSKVISSTPGPVKSANWVPAPKVSNPILAEVPGSVTKFNAWAKAAQTPGNERDLTRAQAYIRHSNLIPSEAQRPLIYKAGGYPNGSQLKDN